MKKKILIGSFIVTIIDLISKLVVSTYLNNGQSLNVIDNFFKITYVYNDGAAFSILRGGRILFIILGIGGIYLLLKYQKDYRENNRNILAFSLIIGGILGNLFDRIVFGYVRDFLDFKIFNYDYPIFNIADSAIFIGVILLIISSFMGEDYGSSSKRKYKNR